VPHNNRSPRIDALRNNFYQRRALGLARPNGAEGAGLAFAILQETESDLLAAAERDAAMGSAAP
jgi:hypothetical protein